MEQMSFLVQQQKEVCLRFAAEYEAVDLGLMCAISENFLSGVLPLNGLRHPQEGHVSGWYVWAGEELSDAPDFFKLWHIHHLVEARPDVAKYLGLGPGWRFLLAGDYEDVWFDSKLLDV
jgi:hypothetical protein